MKIAFALLLLLAWPAFAQQATTAQEQVERTIGALFVANTNLTAQLQATQADLAKANARIKELEPKPDAPKEK